MENYDFEELHALYFSIIPLLQKCNTLHNNHYPDDLNKNQIMAIMIIGKAKTTIPTTLSKFINMEKGSLTTLIDYLEKKEYLKRSSDPNDRRKTILSLTSNGIKQMKIIEEQSQKSFSQMISNLDASEIDVLYANLKSLVNIFKKINSDK